MTQLSAVSPLTDPPLTDPPTPPQYRDRRKVSVQKVLASMHTHYPLLILEYLLRSTRKRLKTTLTCLDSLVVVIATNTQNTNVHMGSARCQLLSYLRKKRKTAFEMRNDGCRRRGGGWRGGRNLGSEQHIYLHILLRQCVRIYSGRVGLGTAHKDSSSQQVVFMYIKIFLI